MCVCECVCVCAARTQVVKVRAQLSTDSVVVKVCAQSCIALHDHNHLIWLYGNVLVSKISHS